MGSKSEECAFLRCLEVTRPIDMMYGTLQYVCLRYSTDDEGEQSLRRGHGISVHGGLSVKDWFAMERLETSKGCVNVLRANYTVAPLTERIPWLMRRFYLNKIYSDC